MAKLAPTSRILIIGSGVFGISTALWLSKSGYRNVTVFDMQDTEATEYDPDRVDSASADLNKIIRFSYGSEIEYQRLAFEAAGLWEKWNEQIASTDPTNLPRCLQTGPRKVWWNSGMLRMDASDQLSAFELQTLENMEKDGLREFQFRSDDPVDLERASARGWRHKIDPCGRQERLGVHKAVLDSTAGWVAAYKSCAWARYLASKAGVKFILHDAAGRVVDVGTSDEKPWIKTADGKTHTSDMVVVAAGGWTPSLIPETSGLLETTAGSIATIQLPADRQDLWNKYSPDNFPVVTWNSNDRLSIYSFPVDEHGRIKIGYRGTKYTNYDTVDGRRISIPKTAHVTEKKESNIPLTSLEAIKSYILANFPDLASLGLASTKLCWYTDSVDNSFVVDHVPARPGIVVCSGGSGHGFKFLPILGREVVRILEGRDEEKNVYGKMWQWRKAADGRDPNGLEEGEAGPRVLARLAMASPRDWRVVEPRARL